MAVDAPEPGLTGCTPGLTGYYRATDILYHYPQSLKNTRDAVPLQKILNQESIIHPSHPLNSGAGIQAYIGTFDDGQARVLFSSAQVAYLRYWMHAMKLTETLIPLPCSDCLFLESEVTLATPIVVESLVALGVTSKKLGRMNQYLKENPLLVSRRSTFERVRSLWSAKTGVWCALNIDAWEVDHTAVLDVGWTLVRWESGAQVEERSHLVIKENQVYKNTQVQDGDEHEQVTMKTLKPKINNLFSQLRQRGPVFLVSDDAKGISKYLGSKEFQVPLADVTLELPEAPASTGVFIVSPAELFIALSGTPDWDTEHKPLTRICKHLNIDSDHVRNAGSDSQLLLQALCVMATGPQLDAQREQRWPGQSETQVQFLPWEEDPKYADLEGLIPPPKK